MWLAPACSACLAGRILIGVALTVGWINRLGDPSEGLGSGVGDFAFEGIFVTCKVRTGAGDSPAKKRAEVGGVFALYVCRFGGCRSCPPPPEIQVTIGRVEIRAVMPPSPVNSPPGAAPRLSLDDYLKQTAGGAR